MRKSAVWKNILRIVSILGMLCFFVFCFCMVCVLVASTFPKESKSGKLMVEGVFDCQFYDNSGDCVLSLTGEDVVLSVDIVQVGEVRPQQGVAQKVFDYSSMLTVSIDGESIHSNDAMFLLVEDGLIADVVANSPLTVMKFIDSYWSSFSGDEVVIIKSQDNIPICAYSGNDVQVERCEEISDTVRIMIDGKALYVHSGVYWIVAKYLLE